MDPEFKKELLKFQEELNRTKNKLCITRSEERLLNQIKWSTGYVSRQDLLEYPQSILYKDQKKAHNILDKAGKSEEERKALWAGAKSLRREYKSPYSLKPIKEGRDNKDVRVGSGGGGSNRIRFPKKGHKNAWKKFYKLFPHLDPNNKGKSAEWPLPIGAQLILNKEHGRKGRARINS